MTKIAQFWSSRAVFTGKKQGTCSRAVRIIPAPRGTGKRGGMKRDEIMQTTKNEDIILAVFPYFFTYTQITQFWLDPKSG